MGNIFHSVIYHDDVDTINYLINSGMNLNIGHKCKRIPLTYACMRGNLEIVKLLLNAGANINIKDMLGQTPLHNALDENIVKLLLHSGADYTIKDYRNRTPVQFYREKHSYYDDERDKYLAMIKLIEDYDNIPVIKDAL
jgi:ankyrin repeat protein